MGFQQKNFAKNRKYDLVDYKQIRGLSAKNVSPEESGLSVAVNLHRFFELVSQGSFAGGK